MPKKLYREGDHLARGNDTIVFIRQKGDMAEIEQSDGTKKETKWIKRHSLCDYHTKLGYTHYRGARIIDHGNSPCVQIEMIVYRKDGTVEKPIDDEYCVHKGETVQEARRRIDDQMDINFRIINARGTKMWYQERGLINKILHTIGFVG